LKLISSLLPIIAASLLAGAAAQAQDYPQRPITFVVGFGAGGGTDINARLFAEVISKNIGQSIVVENKTGAGGAVAATQVQNAAPDGYTLLIMSGLQHVYIPASQSKSIYEPIKGFAPISIFFEMISVLSIPYDYPAKSISEFLEHGKNKNGGVFLGSPGPGSPPHLFGALITEATGLPIQSVQYRGTSNFMADLATGRLDLAFPTYGVAPILHYREKSSSAGRRGGRALERTARYAHAAGGQARARDACDVVWRRGTGRHAAANR